MKIINYYGNVVEVLDGDDEWVLGECPCCRVPLALWVDKNAVLTENMVHTHIYERVEE